MQPLLASSIELSHSGVSLQSGAYRQLSLLGGEMSTNARIVVTSPGCGNAPLEGTLGRRRRCLVGAMQGELRSRRRGVRSGPCRPHPTRWRWLPYWVAWRDNYVDFGDSTTAPFSTVVRGVTQVSIRQPGWSMEFDTCSVRVWLIRYVLRKKVLRKSEVDRDVANGKLRLFTLQKDV